MVARKKNEKDSFIQDDELQRILLEFEIIDEIAQGIYVIPTSQDALHYRYKDLCLYARKTGKDTSELTDEELEMFLVKSH